MFKNPSKGLLALLCLATAGSYAQSTLSEVKVTALKLPQKERNIARDITIIPDSTLRQNEGLGLSELLSRQAGIQIQGAGQTPGSVKTVYMRGASASKVLILLDGVPVYEPSAIGSSFDLNLIQLSNVERIEILRGGQSTLYGSDAMSGVINIITRKSEDEGLSPQAGLVIGSFGQVRANLGIGNRFANGLSSFIGGNWEQSNGISSAEINTGEAEKDGYTNRQLRASLGKKWGSWNAEMYGNVKVYSSDLDAGAFTDDADFTFNSRSFQYGGSLDYLGQKSRVKFNVQQLFIDRTYLDDSTDVPATAFNLWSESVYGSKQSFMDLYWSITLTEHIDFLVGTDFRAQNMNQSYASVSAYGPYRDPEIKKDETEIKNNSLYFSWQSLFADTFGIDLGGRINKHSVYGYNSSFQINPHLKLNQSTLFLNLTNSYRNPALYELFSPYGNTELKPEKSFSGEVGFKREGHKSLNYGLTLFSRTTYDQINFQSLENPPYGVYVNLGKERVNGLEAELSANLNGISTRLNYTYLEGYIFQNLELIQKTDLLRKPKSQLNVSLNKSLGQKWDVGAHGRYMSKRTDRFYDALDFETKEVSLDAYFLLNASLQYKWTKKVSLQGNLNNLLNTKYQEIAGYKSLPINFSIGMIYR